MSPFFKFIEDHHEALAAGAYFFVMAYVVTMPPNWDAGFWKTAWKWNYDAGQEFISQRSGKLVSSPAPKPAIEVPAPKEAK